MRLLTPIAAAGLALYLTGPLAVGLRGLGVPVPLAIVLSRGMLGAAATVLVRRVPRPRARRHRPQVTVPI